MLLNQCEGNYSWPIKLLTALFGKQEKDSQEILRKRWIQRSLKQRTFNITVFRGHIEFVQAVQVIIKHLSMKQNFRVWVTKEI